MRNKQNGALACAVTYFLMAIFIPLNTLAQTSKADPVDGQAWYGLGLKKKLAKDWSLTLAWQGRNYNNMQSHNGDYYSAELSKALPKKIELQAEYRLGVVTKGVYHRYSLGASWQHKVHKHKFSSRVLFQNQLQDFNDVTKANDESLYVRTRFGVKQKLTSWMDLYLQTEPIAKFGGRKMIDNIRNTAGATFSIQKKIDLDLYYIYRPDYAKSYIRTYHILGVELQYTF